jgi:hypothetical protein
MLAVAASAAVLLAGCDLCEEGKLRCNGNVVEECSASNWDEVRDCGADTCGIGREVCHPFIDLGGEVWCCIRPAQ